MIYPENRTSNGLGLALYVCEAAILGSWPQAINHSLHMVFHDEFGLKQAALTVAIFRPFEIRFKSFIQVSDEPFAAPRTRVDGLPFSVFQNVCVVHRGSRTFWCMNFLFIELVMIQFAGRHFIENVSLFLVLALLLHIKVSHTLQLLREKNPFVIITIARNPYILPKSALI
jgi:hypothetical protein